MDGAYTVALKQKVQTATATACKVAISNTDVSCTTTRRRLDRVRAPWGEPPVAGAAAPPGGARRRARIVDFWPGGALDTYRLKSRRRARRRAGWPWSARRGGCTARTRASLHAACRRNDSSAARHFLRRDGQAFCETPLAEIEEA